MIRAAQRGLVEKREEKRNVLGQDIDGDKQTKILVEKKTHCDGNKRVLLQVKRKWSQREDGSPSLS